MKKSYVTPFVTSIVLALIACTSSASAETLVGRVDVVNTDNKTLVVAGITFHTNQETVFNAPLEAVTSVKAGQKVSVDFDRSGSNVYTVKGLKLEQ